MQLDSSRFAKCTAAAVLLTCLAFGSASAQAQTGGSVAPGGGPASSGIPGVATLNPDGSATVPPDAPKRVRKAIAAANKIRYKPYVYGGGHASFKAKGYDCSGAVSYVLHAAGLLKSPLPSGPLGSKWGKAGIGKWITVYGNAGHAYAVIAGLRWDTSAVGESLTSGTGPRWRSTPRSPAGYNARFALGALGT